MSRKLFAPGSTKKRPSLAIKGWRVTYYVPTHGTQEDFIDSHPKLRKFKETADAAGWSYGVRPVFL